MRVIYFTGYFVSQITLTTFLAWKKKKQSEKIKAMYAEKEQRKNDARMGKQFDVRIHSIYNLFTEYLVMVVLKISD